jgi:transcriptional regulator with XRE-family HTH domain
MTPEQSKAARAMVGWGVRDLAKAAEVSSNTVSRLERGAEELQEKTIAKLRTALEKAGIILITENGGGPGVRLRKRKR